MNENCLRWDLQSCCRDGRVSVKVGCSAATPNGFIPDHDDHHHSFFFPPGDTLQWTLEHLSVQNGIKMYQFKQKMSRFRESTVNDCFQKSRVGLRTFTTITIRW